MSRNIDNKTIRTSRGAASAKTKHGSNAHAKSATSRGHNVSPISERVIAKTSAKRRKAMRVLANR